MRVRRPLLLPGSTMESPKTITDVTRGPCEALYWYPWQLFMLAAAAARRRSSSDFFMLTVVLIS
jgi:hypothetical protein